MGDTVQEILQRRGDKKRQGFKVKSILLFLLLFSTYLGLLLEFPLKRTGLWFIFSAATISVCAIFHIFRKDRKYSVEFLFSLALLIAGSAQAFSMAWLRMAYFPFMIFLTAFYGQKTIISLMLLIPFLEILAFIKEGILIEEIAFILILIATVVISLFIKGRMKKISLDEAAFKDGRADLDIDSEEEIKSFSDEKVISHYLESMFIPDDEIKELLTAAKNMIFADSVTLFTSSGSILKLRCSTEESGGIIPSDGGIINLCFKEKKPFVSLDINEKKLDIGYLKKEKVSSLVVVPVMDGNFPLGVMSADSGRFHAFSSADSDILQMFSKQIMRILRRERIYPQIHRSYTGLKILNEESSKLLSSLNTDVIVKNMIDGAYRIAPSVIAFMTVKGREFGIFQHRGLLPQEKEIFKLKGTLLDMAIKNNRHVYISDVRNYNSPILPLKTESVGSLFILPLFYEKDLQGILVSFLEKTNALSPHQIELLEVLGNQASTSIANAKFHAEIERLAITDGLTGLFNHRYFQERLAQEFNRLQRFSEPISLLLIDIDHFKKINDTYGHPVGDLVLKGVSENIKKTMRNIDIPARYGGEEFAVILLGTDTKGALNMAERLRKTVMNTSFSADNAMFHVTVSIGISTYPEAGEKKEEFIERADKALYHAKRSGRNQSVLWNENVLAT